MDYSLPGFPVLHYLPECAQSHVHWVSDAISSSVIPFSSCLQSFPTSGSFPMSWLFALVGQSVRASASASVLPMNNQDWFPLGLTVLISLQSKGCSRVFSSTVQKHQSFCTQPFLWSNCHPYLTTGKILALTMQTFISQVMSLLFNILFNIPQGIYIAIYFSSSVGTKAPAQVKDGNFRLSTRFLTHCPVISPPPSQLLNCGVGEDSWESLGLQGDPASPSWRSVLGVHWKDWCWSWNSNTLAISCKELTHWKRPWYWEGVGAGGEGDDRGWNGWMASPTRWASVWVNSGSWWWTGRPGLLRFMGLQRVGHDWATELNWVKRKPHTLKPSSHILPIKTPWSLRFWAQATCPYLPLQFSFLCSKNVLVHLASLCVRHMNLCSVTSTWN